MSFSIKPGRPVRRELTRVLRHQLQRARAHLEHGSTERVHDARRRVKKARAVVTLLRQADASGLRKDSRRLRDAGRILSTLRDATVVLETFEGLRRAVGTRVPEHTMAAIRRDLARASAQTVATAADDRSVTEAADTLRAVRRSAKKWTVPAIEPLDIPDLVKAVYRAARKAMHRAQRTSRASDLHEWRKRVKTMWYELRLLEPRAPSLRATIRDLRQLETLLGEHHDLHVLQAAVADAGLPAAADARRVVSDVARARQDALRRKAFVLGRRLMVRRPKTFARALRGALSPASRETSDTGDSASPAA